MLKIYFLLNAYMRIEEYSKLQTKPPSQQHGKKIKIHLKKVEERLKSIKLEINK